LMSISCSPVGATEQPAAGSLGSSATAPRVGGIKRSGPPAWPASCRQSASAFPSDRWAPFGLSCRASGKTWPCALLLPRCAAAPPSRLNSSTLRREGQELGPGDLPPSQRGEHPLGWREDPRQLGLGDTRHQATDCRSALDMQGANTRHCPTGGPVEQTTSRNCQPLHFLDFSRQVGALSYISVVRLLGPASSTASS